MIEPPTLNIALAGTSGRMGKAIIAAAREVNNVPRPATTPPPWNLVGAHSSSQSEVDGVPCTTDRDQAFSGAKVVIDFSHGSQAALNLQAAARAGIPCLIGTTALPPEASAAFAEAGEKIAVMHAPNASDGFAILMEQVSHAVTELDYSAEILEFHHADKLDAPSGSAFVLAGIISQYRTPPLEISHELVEVKEEDWEEVRYQALRKPVQEKGYLDRRLDITSFRGGTTAGEHHVIFTGHGERLEVSHIAYDRTPYAYGALTIARKLAYVPPGIHTADSLITSSPDWDWPPSFFDSI